MNTDGLRQLARRFLPSDGQQDVEQALAAGEAQKVKERFGIGMACDIDHGWPLPEAARVLEAVDGMLAA